jgi:nicotinamidase-related amidase
MKHFLIVVDIQKDFVDGTLGTREAQAMVPAAAQAIAAFDGEIFVTYDTHAEDYMATSEGKHLPVPHCIKDSDGWQLDAQVATALAGRDYRTVEKPTFGSIALPDVIRDMANGEPFTVELIGLCTDICVVSNALLLKAAFPEADMTVDAACCAGVSPESHQAALTTMSCCQITISNN